MGGLLLNIEIQRPPGQIVVTGAVHRDDGSQVPVDWPFVILGAPDLTDEDVRRDLLEHAGTLL